MEQQSFWMLHVSFIDFSGEKIGIVDYCRTSWISEAQSQSQDQLCYHFHYVENAPVQHRDGECR